LEDGGVAVVGAGIELDVIGGAAYNDIQGAGGLGEAEAGSDAGGDSQAKSDGAMERRQHGEIRG
jgi:hypothetical protein